MKIQIMILNFMKAIYQKKSATNVPEATRIISVKTKTLDDIIDDINKNIKLIKVEGTGSEPEILEGLKKI